MKWNFIAFIALLCFYSCDDKSTPTIYPSKIGIDSAYKDLAKQDKPIVEDVMKEEEKTLKTSNKIVEKPSRKTISNTDKIVPLSRNNTTEDLVISYAKANAEPTKVAGQTNTFTFNSDSAKKVWIKVSAQDSMANIRINHIKGPADSIKGGPFGKETIFELPARGVYQFSISEKPTNAKPYAGQYKVELKLLWK
ncbi:hypothetical protein OBK28_11595 [Empedobacter falsenii]|uniref:DUF4625 domain-containing protein n=1 Tax=Empedobacter falsenii TaxID=343874 RepID=A0ABY8V6Z9_9FLAO|nr:MULTISPECIES: hypothetical protein [Empedobacter]MDM1521767.1 hypothetical protein [Empedobacter sp. 225-1]MDM1541957.1 hypothetical protein [Empedobacter sp. 189-2]WIH96540.1 hypothetical protein OBA43_09685 [Empedobacter falsenii]